MADQPILGRTADKPSIGQLLRRRLSNSGALVSLLVLIGLVSIVSPSFRNPTSLLLIGFDASFIGIVAAGQTLVILTGGIDLSVESMVGFSSVIAAVLISGSTASAGQVAGGFPSWLAMLIAIGIGGLIGLFQGLIITGLNIHPFIVTLGFFSILQGAALVITNGSPINIKTDPLIDTLQGSVGIGNIKLAVPLLIMLAIYGVLWVLLRHTRFGRYVYAIGGNETATRLSGINVARVKIAVFGLSGMLAAISGILVMGRLQTGAYQNGTDYTLTSVAAVVIGGTALAGGSGGVWGTVVGVFIIKVVQSALVYLDVSSLAQRIVIGTIIVLAVALDVARHGNVPAVKWVRLAIRRRRSGVSPPLNSDPPGTNSRPV